MPSRRRRATSAGRRRDLEHCQILRSANTGARRVALASPGMSALTNVNVTDRQRQVVELLAAGCSNEEIGERLGITSRTAKAHCDVLRQKLGVARRRQIPVAYRLLTGDDPLAKSLKSALADDGD